MTSTALDILRDTYGYPAFRDAQAAIIDHVSTGGDCLVVTNETVAPLYLDALKANLFGKSIETIALPDGEAFKTLETLAGLYDQFVSGGLDRSGLALALGGGVTCDVAGFAAATYMRGLPVVQVPTTLLAMVDASVGGKTAVDLPQGKNLVGHLDNILPGAFFY